MQRRLIALGLWLALAFGVTGCEGPTARTPRRLFHFDGLDKLPDAPLESDAPLQGKAATYRAPLRNVLYHYSGSYRDYDETVFDPQYGPTEIYGSEYSEVEWPSPYFLERSDEETLPDGDLLLNFSVEPSHAQVPADGGSVWARVNISAPAFINRRETPFNLALVLDASESMAEPGKLELLKSAARTLATQLLPSDRVAIVAFDGRARVLVESRPADDQTVLLDAIEGLQVGRGANVGAGLYEAYGQAQIAADTNGGPGNVILLSDGVLGGASGAIWRSVDLARQKHSKGHRLSAIALGKGAESSPLATLTRAGEGRLAFVTNEKDVQDVIAREMGSTLKLFAKNVRLRVVTEGANILAVYGDGIRDRSGARELVLSDFASGEKRSLLLRMKIPAIAAHATQHVKFQLFFTQFSPVRRTILEQSASFRRGAGFGAIDRSVEAHARVVAGLEQFRRALEGEHELFVKNVIANLENNFPRYKAVALAEGNAELIEKTRLFEEFAGRLRLLQQLGKVGSGDEWVELKRDFYSSYR